MSYIIIAIFAGIVQYVGFRAFSLTKVTFNELSEETLPLITALTDLRTAGLRMLASTNEYAMILAENALMDEKQRAEYKKDGNALAEIASEEERELIKHGNELYASALERIRKHLPYSKHQHAEINAHFQHIEEQGQLFSTKLMELVNLKKKGVVGRPILETKDDLEELEEIFLDEIDHLMQIETKRLNTRKQLLFNAISNTEVTLTVAGFLAIAFIFLSGLIVNRAVSKPIRSLINYVHELGKGNLDAIIKSHSKDELGKLTVAVKKMASDLTISIDKEKIAVKNATAASVTAKQEQMHSKKLQHIITERDQEISKRQEFQEKLHLSANVIENAIDGIMLTEQNGTIIQVNPSFTAITGYSAEETIGGNPRILKSDRHEDKFYKNMWDSLLRDGKWQGEIWNRRKNGDTYPEWLSITAIKNSKQKTTHYVAVFHDISEIKRSQEELQYQAYHDPLTHLPNRELFNDRLRKAIEHNKRHHDKLALLYLDLDDFKNINDVHGHFIGDLLLKEVAKVLVENCRAEDTVARLGGDEFVILMPTANSPGNVVDTSKRILKLLSEPFSINNIEIFAGVSIGITFYPDDGDNTETLIKNADMAMYQAKKAGKNMFKVFTQELDIALQARMAMEIALRKAIEREEFSVFYQPKVNLYSGEMVGCEALIRWQDSYGNIISPVAFIPLAEETKLIIPIGEWVLRTSCRQAKLWHNKGYPLKVAVNLSVHQFKSDDFAKLVESILEETGLPPSGLELEVTESILMEDEENAIAILNQLRKLGVTIAIDDFGTGYSSLAYLKKLPIDILKIDRSFIMDIPESQEDMAITRAILSMSKSLGLKVVAEGVETQEHLDFLRKHKCEMMQGYLFSAPVPVEKFDNILQEGKRLAVALPDSVGV